MIMKTPELENALILEGVYDNNRYKIVTMENAGTGFLTWENVEGKLHAVTPESPDSPTDKSNWILTRRKATSVVLSPDSVRSVLLQEVFTEWRMFPVHEQPKSVLVSLFSSKAGARYQMFNLRSGIRRPRTDLGTDKVVTRPGTFVVSELISANITRPLIKLLIDAGVFHMPKN